MLSPIGSKILTRGMRKGVQMFFKGLFKALSFIVYDNNPNPGDVMCSQNPYPQAGGRPYEKITLGSGTPPPPPHLRPYINRCIVILDTEPLSEPISVL